MNKQGASKSMAGQLGQRLTALPSLPTDCIHRNRYLTLNKNCSGNAEMCEQKCHRAGHINQQHQLIEIKELVTNIKAQIDRKRQVQSTFNERLQIAFKKAKENIDTALNELYQKSKKQIEQLCFTQQLLTLMRYAENEKFNSINCTHIYYLSNISVDQIQVARKGEQIISKVKNVAITQSKGISPKSFDLLLIEIKKQFEGRLKEEKRVIHERQKKLQEQLASFRKKCQKQQKRLIKISTQMDQQIQERATTQLSGPSHSETGVKKITNKEFNFKPTESSQFIGFLHQGNAIKGTTGKNPQLFKTPTSAPVQVANHKVPESKKQSKQGIKNTTKKPAEVLSREQMNEIKQKIINKNKSKVDVEAHPIVEPKSKENEKEKESILRNQSFTSRQKQAQKQKQISHQNSDQANGKADNSTKIQNKNIQSFPFSPNNFQSTLKYIDSTKNALNFTIGVEIGNSQQSKLPTNEFKHAQNLEKIPTLPPQFQNPEIKTNTEVKVINNAQKSKEQNTRVTKVNKEQQFGLYDESQVNLSFNQKEDEIEYVPNFKPMQEQFHFKKYKKSQQNEMQKKG